MASWKLPRIQALFFALLFLTVPTNGNEHQSSDRPEISHVTITDCGNTGRLPHRKIPCTTFQDSSDEPHHALSHKPRNNRTPHNVSFPEAIVGIAFTILLCLVYVISDSDSDDAAGSPYPPTDIPAFTYKDIRRITNRFGRSLGRGGFAKVHWGHISIDFQVTLGSSKVQWGDIADACEVVVKRPLTAVCDEVEDAFRGELTTTSKARHENVIKIVGYCKENVRRALVYEFLPRGNLHKHLYPEKLEEGSEIFRSWKLRLNVLLDASKGIEYLHTKVEPRIIHRDIKPSNILIAENWVAKISDFGLSVFGPEEGSDFVEVQIPAGTPDYMDPEYLDNDTYASPRNDVYSFGVVIREVLTAKTGPIDLANPTDYVFDSRLSVPEGCKMEALTKVMQVAERCISLPGVQRPDMTYVVAELENALAMYDP